jgi:hypothetical protein
LEPPEYDKFSDHRSGNIPPHVQFLVGDDKISSTPGILMLARRATASARPRLSEPSLEGFRRHRSIFPHLSDVVRLHAHD